MTTTKRRIVPRSGDRIVRTGLGDRFSRIKKTHCDLIVAIRDARRNEAHGTEIGYSRFDDRMGLGRVLLNVDGDIFLVEVRASGQVDDAGILDPTICVQKTGRVLMTLGSEAFGQWENAISTLAGRIVGKEVQLQAAGS